MVQANPANTNDASWSQRASSLHIKTPESSNRNDGVTTSEDMLNYSFQRSELIRQTEQWHNTGNAVQSHMFDGVTESRDISVYEYLMKYQHEIISFKMCSRLYDCWLSQKVEWHVERGLKLNIDGSPCLQGRSINVD
jgi:hypothetical protein